MRTLDASIIVCTHNRASMLGDCLRSICNDTSKVSRELIVVDNGSTDETKAVIAAVAADVTLPVRLVEEPELGHSRARNAGIAVAAGDVLLFTDDDVVVTDGWADALVRPFGDERVGAAGGRILPLWPSTPPPWLDGPHADLLTLTDYGDRSRLLNGDESPIGANMAVRRSIALADGPTFDPRLGHRGAHRFGHEEFHLMSKIRARNQIVYVAEAIVHHRVDPERMNLPFMRVAFFELGVGLERRERRQGTARLSLAQRLLRTARVARGVRQARRANEHVARGGGETWEELSGYMWAGKHVEMITWRFPRLTSWIGEHLV